MLGAAQTERASSDLFDFSAYIADRTKDFTGRDWAFKEIDEWLTDPDGGAFFLISGAPGCGKSAIAARFVQTCPQVAAFHFCLTRNAPTVDPVMFVRSLSNQLCRFDGFSAQIL